MDGTCDPCGDFGVDDDVPGPRHDLGRNVDVRERTLYIVDLFHEGSLLGHHRPPDPRASDRNLGEAPVGKVDRHPFPQLLPGACLCGCPEERDDGAGSTEPTGDEHVTEHRGGEKTVHVAELFGVADRRSENEACDEVRTSGCQKHRDAASVAVADDDRWAVEPLFCKIREDFDVLARIETAGVGRLEPYPERSGASTSNIGPSASSTGSKSLPRPGCP